MRYLLITLLALLLTGAPAVADDKSEVAALLKEKIDSVVTLLRDKEMDKGNRNDRILAIVSPLFNYPTMAKLSLGKKHWPGLSAEQQESFSALFTARLQQSYLDKLDIYSDEQVSYGELLEKGSQLHAPTTLLSADSKIEILYKFYRTSEGWKIYDVEIGGVSVIQTYRTHFDDVLTTGSIDDLMEKLRSKENFDIPAPQESKS